MLCSDQCGRKVVDVVIAVWLGSHDGIELAKYAKAVQAKTLDGLHGHVLGSDGSEAHAELKRCGCKVEAVRKLDDPLRIASCELVDVSSQRREGTRLLCCTPLVHRVFELASSS